MRTSWRYALFAVAFLAISSTDVTAQGQSDSNLDVLTVCPNGHQCLNGEPCTRRGTQIQLLVDANGLEDFLCNCQGRAGLACENAPEVYCVKGEGAASTNSFCVNEGRCTSVPSDVNPSVLIAGCLCTADFEGPNCQYPIGTAPNPGTDSGDGDGDGGDGDTNGGGTAGIRSAEGDGGGLSTGAIVGISVGAFVATICLACIVKRVFSKDNDPPSVVVGDEQGGEQGF